MLAGSLPTYTDQLLSKISTGLVQLTRTSDRASFYLKVLRPGTYCSLNLTFFLIFVRYSRVLPCDVCGVHKKPCSDGNGSYGLLRAHHLPQLRRPSIIYLHVPVWGRRSYRSSPEIRARSPHRPASTGHDPPLYAAVRRHGRNDAEENGTEGTSPPPAHLRPAVSTANRRRATVITSSPPADSDRPVVQQPPPLVPPPTVPKYSSVT